MMDRVRKIREEEFLKMNYSVEEEEKYTVPVARSFNPLTREIKSCQSKIFQKAIQQKNKPGYREREYETSDNKLEFLKREGDVFDAMYSAQEIEQAKENSPFLFHTFSTEEKMKYIKEYIERKHMKIGDDVYEQIEKILNDENFKGSQYIHVSKANRNITKITFLQKNELGEYNVCMKVPKKEKNFFI